MGQPWGSLTWELLHGISLFSARMKYLPTKHSWTIPGPAPAGGRPEELQNLGEEKWGGLLMAGSLLGHAASNLTATPSSG